MYILAIIPLLILSRLLYHLCHHLSSPLRSIPGPFWTRFSKVWYFNRVRRGHFEADNIHLHQKYGSVVRIAPNQYSVSDIAAVKTIYGTGSKFAKSDWYEGWKHPDPDRWTLFPDRDIKRHAETRKRFSSLYSMSSLVHYEGFVDYCADVFARRLEEFADMKEGFDLGYWLQCYAFDVIGCITFGERFGFLDQGQDIEGAMSALERMMTYSTLIGIYPQWHPRLFGPMSRFRWSGAGGRAYIMKFVQGKIARHNQQKSDPEKTQEHIKTQDFLEKMVIARDKDPEKVTDYHLFMMGQSNVIAGSDTTAISLSSIFYHLLRYPDIFRKLRQEIDEFTAEGRCSEKVTFKESQKMPYFQAVMKEALRMHSATGLPLWRVVPEGGTEISGRFFPAGTAVGINTWVAHYNDDVFPDAKTFRPERWVEAESNPEKLKVMNDMYMPFGLGSRTCIGRHISILEMSKLIPRLVRDFDFTANDQAWSTENYWFVKPKGFNVHIQRRNTQAAA